MARVGSNPVKSPLDGTELLLAQNGVSGDDISVTPSGMREYVYNNLLVAPAGFPGLISATDWTKLNNLLSQAAAAAQAARLAQQFAGFFVGVPVNGSVQFASNAATVSFLLRGVRFAVATGSLTLAIAINGTPITGFEAIPVTTTPTGLTSSGANIWGPNDYLSFTVSSVAGSPTNMWFTLASTVILT